MAYSQKAVNKYRKTNYYTFSVTVPIEQRDAIKTAAAARGMSVSHMVCEILSRELGLDLVLKGELPTLKKSDIDR